ncbi:uncharacterized protein LOC108108970 isoform X2 [Drosophila eugracilis]|uniref:uncharacterized protein LOC108108970 isoform X2 n=1 Tax=Drosophila eugracilis TaxID=29029 RepID=UPI0007E6B781|nr:uncharacterized protein LOC108108970 isoform X2 [Drosophila eugracilis]
MEGFEYVVNPPVWPTVGFLRKIHRDSKNAFCRDSYGKTQPAMVSPNTYDVSKPIGFKYPSKAGFSSLASKSPRLPPFRELGYPPIGTYFTDFPGTQYYFTFNKYVVPDQKWMTPGPSTYSHHLKYPDWNVETAFGSKRIIWPAVAVFCAPQNNTKCSICGQKPVGDYFHNFGSDADMCRKCMHVQVAAIKKCNLQVTERFSRQQKINQFVPARYCGFFHIHDGTTATIERESRKVLRQKIRVENYLYRLNAKEE